MVAHLLLKYALIAPWCLAVAVGCAKATDEAANDAPAIAVEAATGIFSAEVAAAPAAPVEAEAPEPARVASVAADVKQDSIADPPAATEAQLRPPAVSTPDLPPATGEQPILVSAAPAVAPAVGERERGADPIAYWTPRPRGADTLDVTSLLSRLRKTKAINWRAKLAVKNESDDLLELFRDYHAKHGTATLSELRRSYDTLFLKLHSLLEAADPPLARDIVRSRAAIWAILADPVKFESSAPPTRGMPPV